MWCSTVKKLKLLKANTILSPRCMMMNMDVPHVPSLGSAGDTQPESQPHTHTHTHTHTGLDITAAGSANGAASGVQPVDDATGHVVASTDVEMADEPSIAAQPAAAPAVDAHTQPHTQGYTDTRAVPSTHSGQEARAHTASETSAHADTGIEHAGDARAVAAAASRAYPTAYSLARSVDTHTRALTCVKFSPSGRILATASADGSVKLLRCASGAVMRSLDAHTHGCSHVCWSADGLYLATSSDDTTVRVWDATVGVQVCKPLRGHTNYVFCSAISPRGGILASGSFDESLRLWDLRTARCLRTIPAHSEPITSVEFNDDGSVIMTGSYDGLVRFWDTGSGQCMKTLQGDLTPPVSHVTYSPNCKYALVSTLDGRVRLWDYVAAKPVKTYKGHVNTRMCAAAAFIATPARQAVVCGSEDGCVYAYDMKSRDCIAKLRCAADTDPVLAVDAHPYSTAIAVGTTAHPFQVQLWTEGGDVFE